MDDPECDSFHHLYRVCVAPLHLWDGTQRLLQTGASVNHRDEQGWTPLASLLLHGNRGLRWHPYKIPGLGTLEDLNGDKAALEEMCTVLDTEYQEQVHRSVTTLVQNGAEVNAPLVRVPAVLHSPEWIETFEHKLIQSEFRWNLLFSSSMEFSTYSAFNPLTKYCVPNSCDVTLLHMAAWRGDPDIIEILLKAGADAKAVTVGGRTALHFLYLYCNKPQGLPAATKLLLTHGVDVNSVDTRGRTALHLLLVHTLTKRSHVMYLANAFNGDGVYSKSYDPKADNFCEEIHECTEMLLDHGASLDLKGKTALMVLYEAFEHSLDGCDDAFQSKGHYLVPYQFSLSPVLTFSQRLIQLGSQVNAVDVVQHTALHKLVLSIRDLSLNEDLNPQSLLLSCFETLFLRGINVNAQDKLGRTACDHLIDIISGCLGPSLVRYQPVLELFFSHGAHLNLLDHRGTTPLHRLLHTTNFRQKHIHSLLLHLLLAGANPSLPDQENKYPLNRLLSMHVFHHSPLHPGNISHSLQPYLVTLATVANNMTTDTLNAVIGGYRRSGFCGLFCADQCPVFVLLSKFYEQPRSLKQCCRIAITKALPTGLFKAADLLPLPTELKRYLMKFECEIDLQMM